MSDLLADAARRDFEELDRQQIKHPFHHDPIHDIIDCPCCGAKVRVAVDRVSETEAHTKLEFVSYRS